MRIRKKITKKTTIKKQKLKTIPPKPPKKIILINIDSIKLYK